jgi:nucleoside-diphosphate-sugar epimerase
VKGDRYDYSQLKQLLGKKEFDVVIDLIAYQAADSQAAVDLWAGKIAHFIHLSTAAVYVVTQDYPAPLREEDAQRPLLSTPLANRQLWNYALGKRGCEEVLDQAHQEQGFPVTMFRLPIVIGERDYTLRAYSYFLRLKDGQPIILPDGGHNAFTHVWVGDVAKTIASNLLNTRSYGRVYNLAMERVETLRSFIKKAAAVMDVQPELVNLPAELLRQAKIELSFSPFFARRPLILDVSRAREELNYSSTPLDIWLPRTIRWFNEEYSGPPPENYAQREKEVILARRFQQLIETWSE